MKEITSFENRVLRQQAYWVHELAADFNNRLVKLVLIADPESREIDGTILFKDIYNLKQDQLETEDLLPGLLGILNVKEETSTRYTITTELTEISFNTSTEPEVIWVDPTKPKQQWKHEKLRI